MKQGKPIAVVAEDGLGGCSFGMGRPSNLGISSIFTGRRPNICVHRASTGRMRACKDRCGAIDCAGTNLAKDSGTEGKQGFRSVSESQLALRLLQHWAGMPALRSGIPFVTLVSFCSELPHLHLLFDPCVRRRDPSNNPSPPNNISAVPGSGMTVVMVTKDVPKAFASELKLEPATVSL